MQIKAHGNQTKQNQLRNEHQTPHIAQAQYEDNRPELADHLQQQTYMANSPKVKKLQTMQRMMMPSPQVRQSQSMQAMMTANSQAEYSEPENSSANNLPAQRMEEDEPLQPKADQALIQREQTETPSPKPNNTGLPNNLKTGIENLSGMSMDHVRVYYNSDKPAQLQAHAYAQGSEIHVASGQEKHLPHEVWHVVQQAEGRVRPTVQMRAGIPVNDDADLEHEADVMGGRAFQMVMESQNIRPESTHQYARDRYGISTSSGISEKPMGLHNLANTAASDGRCVVQRELKFKGTTTTVDDLMDILKNALKRRPDWFESLKDIVKKILAEADRDNVDFKSSSAAETYIKKKLAANESEVEVAKMDIKIIQDTRITESWRKEPFRRQAIPVLESALESGVGLTIIDIKNYLSAPESECTSLYYDLAQELRHRTYRQNEDLADGSIVTDEIFGKATRSVHRKKAERDKDNVRGVPTEYHAGTLTEMDESEEKEAREIVRSVIPNISSRRSGMAVVSKLATDPHIRSYAFLVLDVIKALRLLDGFWAALSPKGQQSICDMILKMGNNGDAKGVYGEIMLAYECTQMGQRNIDIGTDEKLSPEAAIKVKKATQDVDVSFRFNDSEGVSMVYAEAKYDALTFIGKYASFDESLGKSKQQYSYEDVRETHESSALMFYIANPHDWLLLFIPGGSGLKVIKSMIENAWIANLGGTILGPLDCSRLIDLVRDKCETDGIVGSDRESWAERESSNLTPDDFLT